MGVRMAIATTAKCPACGAPLSPDAPMGLCVSCLFNSAANPESEHPTRFAGYELLDGGKAGGMGVVFRARQINLDRIVALKMIRGAFLATPAQAQRFRAEAEAAACLDHPSIVPVYEVGDQDGHQYFTMKWIEGGSLADSLRSINSPAIRNRTPDESTGRELAFTPLRAAEMISTIARAVHHSHQRGIIHRDLKPSNILLDANGEPHVSDFGLAKRLDSNAAITLTDQALGTPAYMAPEQAAGKTRDLTTAADIYSLGAILYEMLTGQPPFTADTPAETIQKVLNEDPKRPGAVSKPPRELETICFKCLEKDPRLRYPSAEALADDLDRWLRGEPIAARPSGAWARLHKWARRKPAVASLAATIVILALAGLTITLVQAKQTARFARQAMANLVTARKAVAQLISLVREGQIQDPAFDAVRAERLKAVVPFLEYVIQQGGGDPSFEADRAEAYADLAFVLYETGNIEQAKTNFLRAIDLQTQLVNTAPRNQRYRRDLADTQSKFATLLTDTGHHKEAVAAQRNAASILTQLVTESPLERTYQEDLLKVQLALARSLARGNQGAEAKAIYRKATELGTPLATGPLATPASRYQLGLAFVNLGNVVSNNTNGRPEAEIAWNRALELFSKLAADFPRESSYQEKLALTQGRLSRLYADLERWERAETCIQEELRGLEQLVAEYPWRPAFQHDLADHYWQTGARYAQVGRTNEARSSLQQAVTVGESLVERFPELVQFRGYLAVYYSSLAELEENAGRPALARAALERALAIREKLSSEFPTNASYAQQLKETRAQLEALAARQGP
jgi:tetratricopeptide (TPR) repeat protein/tRNA A-37 threonylcarbamoyl transferase component Bud32